MLSYRSLAKRIITIILSLCVFISVLYIGIHTIYIQSHKAEAREYLIEKYDFEKNKLYLLDYKASKFHNDSDMGIPFDFYRANAGWKFRYKGRTFGVVKDENNVLSDNYQLEELYQWSTEYFRDYIDPNIAGVKIENETYSNIFSKSNIKAFLDTRTSYTLYYRTDNLQNFYNDNPYQLNNNYQELKRIIENKCKEFSSVENISLYLININVRFKRKLSKTRESDFLYCFDIKEKRSDLYYDNQLIGE